MIEQARFTCSPLGKAFKKQTNEDQRRKQLGAIMNKKERQVVLIDNVNNLSLKEKERKEIFYKLVKEGISNETNFDDLICYYKNMRRRDLTISIMS